MNEIKRTLESLMKFACTKPDQIRFDWREWDQGFILTVHPAPVDYGKMVGKGGTTDRAFKFIAQSIGAAGNPNIIVRFEPPERFQNSRVSTKDLSDRWDPKEAINVISRLCGFIFKEATIDRVDISPVETLLSIKANGLGQGVRQQALLVSLDKVIYTIGLNNRRKLRTAIVIDGESVKSVHEFV